MKRNTFFILLGVLFSIVLFNLDKIPIAWGDESFFIDPAIHFIRTGHFSSYIWPYQGTENVFLAYLPLTSSIQIPFLYFFPDTLFFSRLPYLLAFIGFLFFTYKIFKEHFKLKSEYIYFLILLILVDEGFAMALRSARVEVYILFLESWILYNFFIKKNTLLNASLIGILSITHPAIWIFCLIIFLFQFLSSKNILEQFGILVLSALPLFLYLVLADFDFHNIYQQLIVHGEEHSSNAVSGWPVINHFYKRFLPIYFPQPTILLLNLLLFIYSIKEILKNKFQTKNILELLFLFTSIYWIFALAPFPRYTVSLVILIYFISIKIILNKSYPIYFKASITFLDKYKWHLLMLYALPFLSRNLLGIVQYNERNPKYVLQWLDKNLDIKNEKVLLIDATIAQYYSLDKMNVDFTLTYAVKKFDFKKYDKVFYVSERAIPDSCIFISEFKAPKGLLPASFGGVQTYDGLKIYRVDKESIFKKLQRIY